MLTHESNHSLHRGSIPPQDISPTRRSKGYTSGRTLGFLVGLTNLILTLPVTVSLEGTGYGFGKVLTLVRYTSGCFKRYNPSTAHTVPFTSLTNQNFNVYTYIIRSLYVSGSISSHRKFSVTKVLEQVQPFLIRPRISVFQMYSLHTLLAKTLSDDPSGSGEELPQKELRIFQ